MASIRADIFREKDYSTDPDGSLGTVPYQKSKLLRIHIKETNAPYSSWSTRQDPSLLSRHEERTDNQGCIVAHKPFAMLETT
jgi:hypothetical protein